MNNIEVSFEDYKDKLPERTIEILDKLIEKLQDEHTLMIDEENNKEFKNYRMFKINEVKLMIYNETGTARIEKALLFLFATTELKNKKVILFLTVTILKS